VVAQSVEVLARRRASYVTHEAMSFTFVGGEGRAKPQSKWAKAQQDPHVIPRCNDRRILGHTLQGNGATTTRRD
jgi:hypothetical protein